MVLTSGVTYRERTASTGKLNVKTEPLLVDILIFSILLVFSRSLFLCFSGCVRFTS